DVLRDHIEATRVMIANLEQRGERVDVIVWPENSGEFQLPEQTFRALEVEHLAQQAGAPIVVGTVLQDSEEVFTNSSVVIDGSGVTDLRYDKRRPVPFAEYMPNRAFFRALVPDLVDLVQLDYAFGDRPAVFDIEIGTGTGTEPDAGAGSGTETGTETGTGTAAETIAGRVLAGIAICFDIIFDDHALAMNNDGAEIIFAQTNNADFGRTDESAQQLQIARLRAVEMGKAVVNISTVGTSAIVLPDGTLTESLEPFTADAMVAEVELFTGTTPALHYGARIAGATMALGLFGALAALVALSRPARRDRSPRRDRSVATD
ncbi:MAG: apolipoprotein N-acyltransferase, partial [Leucobacter sp.]|nr:apolipoprotein N-acyltransferase [Leucobacter sp.]